MKAIRINPQDNVAVALENLSPGDIIRIDDMEYSIKEAIQIGHKFALCDVKKDCNIIKYGLPIGHATSDIMMGSWVHTHNISTNLSENSELSYMPKLNQIKKADPKFINAYRRKDGRIGIRNEVWIVPVVGCVNSVAKAIEKKSAEFVTGSIDGVYSIAHPYGCSQVGEDLNNTKKILSKIIKHPNASAVLVIFLGCENLTYELLAKELGDISGKSIRFLVSQYSKDEIEEGMHIVKELCNEVKTLRRERVSVSELVIGLKCGSSDGLSGITANPLVGSFSDKMVSLGGTTILTEVPEMFGVEEILFNKCLDNVVFDKACRMINDSKNYFVLHGQAIYDNLSSENKKEGITTLEDKACGCVQKGGTSPIVDVLPYASTVTRKGLNLLTGPENDLVSCTNLMASGCHIILFTTGRGSPFGTLIPTIKISSNNDLFNRKTNWIDFNAGLLVADNDETGEKMISMDFLSDKLLSYVLDVANGKKTHQEEYEARDIAIFKDGVTL